MMATAADKEAGQKSYQLRRRKARQWALQVLYQLDVAEEPLQSDTMENFWQRVLEQEVEGDQSEAGGYSDQGTRDFAERLIRGVVQRRAEIDAEISGHASNWRLDRMGVVDRNILRLSAYEMVFSDETPLFSALNEGLELAKQFGDKDSRRFINGVLDKLKDESPE